jgi:segregation and condensation protein B
VAVSSNIIKTLHEREWIRVVGHRDVPGRPAMYATTRQFLDYFNLKTLDQLPALADIRDLETLNVELGFSDPMPAHGPGAGGPGLTLVGGTDHVQDSAAAGDDAVADEDALEPRDTTALDLAITAAELVDDETPVPAADVADPDPEAADSMAAGPDSRA